MANVKTKEKSSLGLLSLTGIVVGSVIGAGVFNLMQDMSAEASLMAIIIGWLITGLGILFLVLCFQNLNKKKPELDAGIYSYAEAGFGKFLGFNSAWGYWISAWIGNVAYATLLFSSVGYFISTFGTDGQNLASVIGASAVLWLVHYLILRGVKTSALVNVAITAAKLVPLAIFILAAFAAFKLDIFTADIWGTASGNFEFGDILNQVKSTMLVTVWVFIGIEGAVIFSGRAKNKKSVPRATFLGLLLVTSVYLLVSVLSLGIMSRPELAELGQPAMAALLESVAGPWGATLINLGLIISVGGAWLAWTMNSMELPYRAAKNGTFPALFAKENKRGVPVYSLFITNILVQAFLLLFLTPIKAYDFMYSLATSTILIPYALVAFYQMKLSLSEKASTPGRTRNIIIGSLAAVYSIWLVYAAGLDYLLLTVLLYVPGTVLYILMRLRRGQKVFTLKESVVFLVIALLCAWCIQRIASGDLVII